MKLRVQRTFTWELTIPRSEVKLGGNNPYKLVPHDELQLSYGDGIWAPVEVVEMEKPPHPRYLSSMGALYRSLIED
jgi:hypothetical protein